MKINKIKTLNVLLIVLSIVLLHCKKNPSNNKQVFEIDNSGFKVSSLGNKVWRIDDNGRVNMYLVEGDEKALLIDTGYDNGSLWQLVKTITKLPVVVVNTHNHPDHAGGNAQFTEIYAHPLDLSTPSVKPVKEGLIFDLGNRKLEVIEVPGHTPGSIVLLDPQSKYLFAGDNSNEWVWLFLSNSRPLTAYIKSLQKLQKRINEFDYILPGHGEKIDKTFINEQVVCVSNIISGKCKGKAHKTFIGSAPVCTYKRAGVLFDRNKIR